MMEWQGEALEVSDAHVHFFSHTFFSKLAPAERVATLGWDLPPVSYEELAAKWVAELDRQGVTRAALIASLPGEEESVAAARRAYPSRFFAYAMVNPKTWDAKTWDAHSMTEMQVACLFPAMHGYYASSDIAAPVFEWARQNRRAVFVHCGELSVGVRKKLGLPSPFDMRYSNPIDLHPVALQYPDVPMIVPHFGAGYLREALMLADLCPNVYLDTSSSNAWMRFEGLSLEAVFQRALAVVGPKRLLFGTDSSFFPRGWNRAVFEAQKNALLSLGVGSDDARQIFSQNLVRILAA